MVIREITRGEDVILVPRIVWKRTLEPYDLTGWTRIVARFRKMPSGYIEKTSDLVPAQAALSTFEGVTYTAVTSGVDGNSIVLVFSGSNTIQDVVDAWNVANPTNQVSHDAADGSTTPSATTITLTGGKDAFRYVTVLSEVLSKIQVNLIDTDTSQMRLGRNLSYILIIDKGEERRVVRFENALDVLDATP